jgi:hypothetical protein
LIKGFCGVMFELLRAAEPVFFPERRATDPFENFPAIGVNFMEDLMPLPDYLEEPDFLTGVLYLEAVVSISLSVCSS